MLNGRKAIGRIVKIFKEHQIKKPFIQESNLQLQISDHQANKEVLRRLLVPVKPIAEIKRP